MAALLRHRGPDGQGTAVCGASGHCGLVSRRLAVIDPAGSAQPLANESDTVFLVFNGEIYNFRALRRELEERGHRFRTHGDGEVIVHLYEELGPRCVERLEGMFAFAVWDETAGELTLARDRLGQKPLYWTVQGRRLLFASESRALVGLPGLPRELDAEALDFYLRLWYVPAPWSIWRGVRQLAPATTMTWKWRRGPQPVNETVYWRPEAGGAFAGDEREAAEELLRLLRAATHKRLVSDVPVGAFLSGGLDSSTVVALMAEQAGAGIPTFSIGYAEAEHDERAYAQLAAERFGCTHETIELAPPPVDELLRLARVFDEPLGDSSALPSWLLARHARQRVTVVLTGDGGDESFGGYLRYAPLLDAACGPGAARRRGARFGELADWDCHWRLSGLKRLLTRRLCSADEHYFRLMSVLNDEHLARLYSPEARRAVPDDLARRWFRERFYRGPRADAVGRAMHADLHSYLPYDINMKVDRATMAVGLEARSPLLDHAVVEFAAGLPREWKIRRCGDGRVELKRLLKRVAGGLLPRPLIDRPKMGFALPLRRWLAGPWAEFTRAMLLGSRVAQRGIFYRPAIARLIEQHRAGMRDHSQRLWQLLFLELWLRQHYDVAPAGLPAAHAARPRPAPSMPSPQPAAAV